MATYEREYHSIIIVYLNITIILCLFYEISSIIIYKHAIQISTPDRQQTNGSL